MSAELVGSVTTWLPAPEYAARIRAGLRRLGFRGSVRHGRGTAYSWVEIRGTAPYGEFTPQEAELLTRLGFSVGGNLALIAPERETRSAALAAIDAVGGEP